ncbi:MAG TPA: hypothetical protein VIJ85_11305 [Rhizomicrobium sp.]
MIDDFLRKHAVPAHSQVAVQLAALGFGGAALTALALAFGLAAAASIAAHFYILGLAFFILSRVAVVLAGGTGSVAGLPVCDLIIYGALTFGFAVADPARALAASFLLFGIVVLASCAVMFDTRQSARPSEAAVIGFVIFLAVVLACIVPDRFSLVAYLLGLLCFPAAGMFAASSLARRP